MTWYLPSIRSMGLWFFGCFRVWNMGLEDFLSSISQMPCSLGTKYTAFFHAWPIRTLPQHPPPLCRVVWSHCKVASSRPNFSNLISTENNRRRKAYSTCPVLASPLPIDRETCSRSGAIPKTLELAPNQSLLIYIYHAVSFGSQLSTLEKDSISTRPIRSLLFPHSLPLASPGPSFHVAMSTAIDNETPKNGTIVSVVVALVSISIISSFLSMSIRSTTLSQDLTFCSSSSLSSRIEFFSLGRGLSPVGGKLVLADSDPEQTQLRSMPP